MRKAVSIFAISSLVVSIIISAIMVSAVVRLFYVRADIEEDGKEFALATAARVWADWDSAKLIERATPGLQETLSDPEAQRTFERIAQLGPMQELGTARIECYPTVNLFTHKIAAQAGVRIEAEFEVDKATIDMHIILRNGQWRVKQFTVHSPALLN